MPVGVKLDPEKRPDDCATHPKYKAVLRPRARCLECLTLYLWVKKYGGKEEESDGSTDEVP